MAKLEDMEKLYPGKRLKLRAEVWEWIDEQGGKPFLRKLIYKLFSQAKAKQIIEERRRRDEEHFKKPGIAHYPTTPRAPQGSLQEQQEQQEQARRSRAEDDGVNYDDE